MTMICLCDVQNDHGYGRCYYVTKANEWIWASSECLSALFASIIA